MRKQEALEAWLTGRLPPATQQWMADALAAADRGLGDPGFVVRWSGAGRRLGRTTLALDQGEAARLSAAGALFVPQGWGQDELGRALLLLAAAAATPAGALVTIVDELFRTGEMREQQALLRSLAYLPQPERFAPVAAEAVRLNVLTVLEALVCDNPYPAAHMPELAFNQMIMKAIFNGLPLGRVQGLSARLGPELRRMVSAYASERRAAGRLVPADVDLVLGGTEHAPV